MAGRKAAAAAVWVTVVVVAVVFVAAVESCTLRDGRRHSPRGEAKGMAVAAAAAERASILGAVTCEDAARVVVVVVVAVVVVVVLPSPLATSGRRRVAATHLPARVSRRVACNECAGSPGPLLTWRAAVNCLSLKSNFN